MKVEYFNSHYFMGIITCPRRFFYVGYQQSDLQRPQLEFYSLRETLVFNTVHLKYKMEKKINFKQTPHKHTELFPRKISQ